MASNIEGNAASNVARGGSYSNKTASNLAGFMFLGDAFGGGKEKSGSSSRGSGKDAYDYYNENVMKNEDVKREGTRIRTHSDIAAEHAKEGRSVKRLSSSGVGAWDMHFENGPAQPTTGKTIGTSQQFSAKSPWATRDAKTGRMVSVAKAAAPKPPKA